jgi:hypothetical protein
MACTDYSEAISAKRKQSHLLKNQKEESFFFVPPSRTYPMPSKKKRHFLSQFPKDGSGR